jgi:hypothetical protein
LNLRLALAALSAALLAACGGADVKYDAAKDVRTFIMAVREGDRTTFDRHIDRPAVKAAVVRELQQALAEEDVGGLGAMLGPKALEAAADQLISPEAFRFAAERGGLGRTPTAAEIATQLKVLEPGRVCLANNGACVLTFADRGGVWKLVEVQTGGVQAGAPPADGFPMQQAWPSR